jgi:simple sugar transport system permease protein
VSQSKSSGLTVATSPADQNSSWRSALRQRAQLAVWPALIVLVIVGILVNPAFLTGRNILNVFQQASVLSVLTLAQLLVVIVRKFDLSSESTVAFAPMLAATIMLQAGAPGWTGFAITLLVGVMIGAANALLVVYLRLNAFICTLAMLIFLRGATLGISTGETIYAPPMPMIWPGSAFLFGIPVSVVISAILYVSVWFVLRQTTYGRSLYAIGGNPMAAKASGINVTLVTASVFLVAGVLSAFAGLMLSGRIESITANQGQSLIFFVIASLAIGGVSLNGGKGTVLGALSGVLFLSLLANILVLAGLNTFWVDMTRGGIIMIALVIARLTGGASDD